MSLLRKIKLAVICGFCLFFIVACDQKTEQEIINGTTGLTNPNEVQTAIGPADEISKLGNTEIWKYETTSSDVCFIVAGDTIVKFSCI
jgi:preprotein translocase subunit YajC